MNILTYDLETFWSTTHSLTKMNPIEYIMHPETEIQSMAAALNDGEIGVFFGEERIRWFLSKIDWSNTMVVAHNGSGFDHLILAWRLGIRPKAYACTLAMARPFYSLTVGGSLKKVAEAMGIGAKGNLEEINTKGKKLKDFTPEEIDKMRVYNKQDTHLCREIFYALAPRLGKHEMKLIDLTIRMTAEPKLVANLPLLESALAAERARKQEALLTLAKHTNNYVPGMTPEQAAEAMRPIVMSQPKFAELLTSLGATVPMKESLTAIDEDGYPKMIPALAKNDSGMEELLEHDDPVVRMAAATRLEVKTTQLETRLQTFITVSRSVWNRLPMPINYCGAGITWRMSGGMKMNCQNMPRVNESEPKPTDALRQSIEAPEGFAIVAVDSSNIELRVAHALAGQMDTVEKLRLNPKYDLYSEFAGNIYGRTVTKADITERYLGKQAMLQLQFNASWRSFQKTAYINSKGKVDLDDREAKRIVDIWRGSFPQIAGNRRSNIDGMWQKCERALEALFMGQHTTIDPFGLCQTTTDFKIMTPAMHWLQYPNLRKNMNAHGKDEWIYGDKQHKAHIFGGKVFANCLSSEVEVLTDMGWKRIVEVDFEDTVWDGFDWVEHEGMIARGNQTTIYFGGAYLTPDHKVLVGGEWVCVRETTYQQATASFSKNSWLPQRGDASKNPPIRQEIQSRQEQVYDLLNAGPNHCFTVRGADGQPFLVHNCVQHIARIIVMEQTLILAKKYNVVLSCHDEAVLLVRDEIADAVAEEAQKVFAASPKWWPDLPLFSEAGVGYSYAEAK